MITPILVAEGLVKTYDNGRVRALDGLDLRINPGEFVSIVGPSGSGKSTLLHMLGALDRPDSGRVLLDGDDLAGRRRLDRVRARQEVPALVRHALVVEGPARLLVEVGVGKLEQLRARLCRASLLRQ